MSDTVKSICNGILKKSYIFKEEGELPRHMSKNQSTYLTGVTEYYRKFVGGHKGDLIEIVHSRKA